MRRRGVATAAGYAARIGSLAGALSGALAIAAVAAGCGAPPWRMGSPLDGRPAIPPDQARLTVAQVRAAAIAARAAGRTVIELQALLDLDAPGRLEPAERARLVDLLVARAAVFHDMGRAIPESGDLEAVARLDPGRGASLATERAAAAVAAGDAWKAIGAQVEARNAYARAAWLGGVRPSLGDLPPAGPPPRAPSVAPPDVAAWVLAGPALSARLLPLVDAYPSVLDDLPRALGWADLLLGEDPTSPDVRAMVALIFGRAKRFGGTERMLMELVYYSPDRAAALARGAAIWDRLGRAREACAQWIRAARWRDDPEDPLWRRAVACARLDPGAGDWREIRDYVLTRAAPARRAAIAAELDPASRPDGGAGPDGGSARSPERPDARPDGGVPGPS